MHLFYEFKVKAQKNQRKYQKNMLELTVFMHKFKIGISTGNLKLYLSMNKIYKQSTKLQKQITNFLE